MKLAIYLDNSGIKDINCAEPLLGNPGVGGTEYCFLLLIDSIKRYSKEIELVVYLKEPTCLPFDCDNIVVENIFEAIRLSEKNTCDIFLMRNQVNKDCYEKIDNVNQKIIVWGHNFYLSDEADLIAKNKNIVLNVFVGRQQYDRYVDHDICQKSTFIFNMVPKIDCGPRSNDSKTVVYLGALVHAKGFHILARQWKKILRSYPSATLKVIGTNKVYDRRVASGEGGISNETYENKFMKYIKDDNGKLLNSVEFLGLLGKEKSKVFSTASVGVVNPSGKTETFGMGIIEMNQFCLPVVTVKKFGFLDTIIDKKTGLLFGKKYNIYKGIVSLLKNQELNNNLGEKAKEKSMIFIPEKIINDWFKNFENIINNKECYYQKPEGYYFSNLKIIRIINRFFRISLRFTFLPSVVKIETVAWKFLQKTK